MKRPPTQKQVSAGGVVFKKPVSGIRICLIARRVNSRIIWCLPKGHVEKGESLEQTALREVREETGISGSTLSSLGSIRYSFFDLESGRRILKSVYFFLIRYRKGKTRDHDHEVEHVQWFPVSKALKHALYPSERKVLKKAVRVLEQLK